MKILFTLKILLLLFIVNSAVASNSSPLEKFNSEFQCGEGNEHDYTCVDVNPFNDAVYLGTCGYNIYKEYDVISKTPTRIIFTSTNNDRHSTEFHNGLPKSSFLFILTDLWERPINEGKNFSLRILELGQQSLTSNDVKTMNCKKIE